MPPDHFNTWPLVRSLAATARSRLEVAPGLNPRLPLAGTRFLDASAAAVDKLVRSGGDATVGRLESLPYDAGSFDLVAAFDVIEHLDDDEAAVSELSRVASANARLLISVPLHPSRWTAFDELVGHGRRYRPEELRAKMAAGAWSIEQSAVYGMQPQSKRLLDLAVWGFEHRLDRAMWWYSRVILPLGVRFQKSLELRRGLIDVDRVDEVLLVCRKASPGCYPAGGGDGLHSNDAVGATGSTSMICDVNSE